MEKIRKTPLLLILLFMIILVSSLVYALEFPIKSYIYQGKSCKSYDFEPYGLQGTYFQHVFYDSGKFWLVDSINIYKMSIKSGNLYKVDLIKNMRNIYKDRNGILWISALEKLYKVKKGEIVGEIDWPDRKWFEVKQVIEDDQGNLYFLSYREIIRYDKKSWELILQSDVFEDYNRFYSFGIDNYGTIYVCCHKEEDVLAGAGKVKIVINSNSKWITIYEAKYGPNYRGMPKFIIQFKEKILFNFIGWGMYLYNDKCKFEKFGNENIGSVVYCAKKDKKGKLWLGTNKGLVEYNNKEFKFLNNPYTGVEYNKKTNRFTKIISTSWENVYSIDFDNKKNIWCSSGSGVSLYILSGK